jgi:hypothetical protein
MGLDISHNAWHGSYSSFGEWRRTVAELAGFPPLDEMRGFGGSRQWGVDGAGDLRLIPLLHHSDCNGEISPEDCAAIADALKALLDKPWPDDWLLDKTRQFIVGARTAAAADEPLEFR